MKEIREKFNGRFIFLAISASLVLSAIPFYGLWGDSARRYLGAGELEGWLWRFWWFRKLLESIWAQEPRNYGLLIFTFLNGGSFPEAGNIFDLQFFSLPLRHLLGAPLYYNAEVFIILILNGLSGYALFLHISKRPWLSLIGCGLLTINPYVLYELSNGRPRQAMLFTLPLFFIYLDKSRDSGRLPHAAAAGLFLGLTSVIYLFYGMSALFFLLIYVLHGLFTRGSAPTVKFAPKLAVILLVFLSVSIPFSWRYLQLSQRGNLPEVTYLKKPPSIEFFLSDRKDAADADDLSNSLYRMKNGSMPWDFITAFRGDLFVPFVFVFTGIILLLFNRKPPWLWIITLALFYLLSLGPYLKGGAFPGNYIKTVSGGPVKMLFGYFFTYVPFVSRLFEPMRFLGMFWVALGALSAQNLKTAGEFFDNKKYMPWLEPVLSMVFTGLLIIQIFSSGILPLPSTEVKVPDFYLKLGQQKEKFGLIEMPLSRHHGDYLNYCQIYHNKKLLRSWAREGSLPEGLNRGEAVYLAQNDYNPRNGFIAYLESLNNMPAEISFDEEGLLQLKRAGYRYLIVHQYGCSLLSPERADELYVYMVDQLKSRLGPPIFTEIERTDEGASGGYEMTVFSLEGTKDQGK